MLHYSVAASTPGRKRLQIRFSERAKQLTTATHGNSNRARVEGTNERRWDNTRCRSRDFILTPSNKAMRYDLTRHSLVHLNRVRKCYGTFKNTMNKMGLSSSASCQCALQVSADTTSPASVRYADATGTYKKCEFILVNRGTNKERGRTTPTVEKYRAGYMDGNTISTQSNSCVWRKLYFS